MSEVDWKQWHFDACQELARLRAALAAKEGEGRYVVCIECGERMEYQDEESRQATYRAMMTHERAHRDKEIAAAVAAFREDAEKRVRELASCWVGGVTDVEREKGVSLMNAAENIARLPASRESLDRMLAEARGEAAQTTIRLAKEREVIARREGAEKAIRLLMADWDVGVEEGEDVVSGYLKALGLEDA